MRAGARLVVRFAVALRGAAFLAVVFFAAVRFAAVRFAVVRFAGERLVAERFAGARFAAFLAVVFLPALPEAFFVARFVARFVVFFAVDRFAGARLAVVFRPVVLLAAVVRLVDVRFAGAVAFLAVDLRVVDLAALAFFAGVRFAVVRVDAPVRVDAVFVTPVRTAVLAAETRLALRPVVAFFAAAIVLLLTGTSTRDTARPAHGYPASS